jgi:MFS family permease
MIAIGLKDTEIGFIATVYMLMQVVFAFLSGPITDKLGRRKTTAIFDFVAWSVPCLIWWRAENFWFFLVAALFNGSMKVTTNSWDCLLVEDAEKSQITRLYSLVVVCGQLSALFAPISSIMVSRLTLVPAIRILYINAFVVMTVKIIVLYFFCRETGTGMVRLRETKGKSILELAGGYGLCSLVILSGSLVALHVNKAERARVMAIQHMVIMFATSPFGWIGGLLSSVSRSLPFVLTMVLLLSGIFITLVYYTKGTATELSGANADTEAPLT